MSDDAPQPPAGWYPTPDGAGQRYWDGSRWLDVPAPPSPRTSVEEPIRTESDRSARRALVTTAVLTGCILILGIGGAITWKVLSDQQVAQAELAADEKAADERYAERRAEERAEVDRERRAARVGDIEEAVQAMAEKHSVEGLFAGPILYVDCTPVAGGSIEDLSEETTVFECFVATDRTGGNVTGTMYNATMNWSTGGFTYGFGAP